MTKFGDTQKTAGALSNSGVPHLTLSAIVRELIVLAKAPCPRELFPQVPVGRLSMNAVNTIVGTSYEGFRVWPILLQAGYRGVPAAAYDTEALRCDFPQYMRARSPVVSAISEAARNVAQHGRADSSHVFRNDMCFAPGAIFLKEVHHLNPSLSFLMCMVSDEGMGIEDPSRSLVPGVGSWSGEDGCGLGYELSDSVVMMIRARSGAWFLFDGLHESADKGRASKPDGEGQRRVLPLAKLDLPSGSPGCRKIFVFQREECDGESVFQCFVEGVKQVVLDASD